MNSAKIEIDKLTPSVDGIKKIATLIGMIDNLNVPDIVCAFEDVDDIQLQKILVVWHEYTTRSIL